MSLRYKGVPQRGMNRQVDDLPTLCFCEFVFVGMPLKADKCETHKGQQFGCDFCQWCSDYRPVKVKKSPNHWPRCTCGHIAQDHNK